MNQKEALRERLRDLHAVPPEESVGDLPPYVDAFLAHLRLLVGVPFGYLVPDARLLPPESIRFFYVDRSWTDRLVDGTIAVGQIGTRELRHARDQAATLQRSVDGGERLVRKAQRNQVGDWRTERQATDPAEANAVTGLLLRSGLVSGWPHLEVRASSDGVPLPLARMERLSPGVLIALFFGVPDRVELEEPHHGVQLGLRPGTGPIVLGRPPTVHLRHPDGSELAPTVAVPVPFRPGGHGVVHAAELRRRLIAETATHPDAIPQTGSAAFALTALRSPYLQPFAGEGETPTGGGPKVADRVTDQALVQALKVWVAR